MKKKFKMENLDCANCAAKMEAAIKKIPGVQDASMNFMTQKLTPVGHDDLPGFFGNQNDQGIALFAESQGGPVTHSVPRTLRT